MSPINPSNFPSDLPKTFSVEEIENYAKANLFKFQDLFITENHNNMVNKSLFQPNRPWYNIFIFLVVWNSQKEDFGIMVFIYRTLLSHGY